jgi:hypothetical protein
MKRPPGKSPPHQSSWKRCCLPGEANPAGHLLLTARQQARQARDTQLQELFGANYDQWIEANRHEPARAIVAQIVQQTFQSSGALTTAQADELTRIVAQHRIPLSKQTGARQFHYDWDQIITDAHSLLADRQREAFITAIEYRRASEAMSAMAAKQKQ